MPCGDRWICEMPDLCECAKCTKPVDVTCKQKTPCHPWNWCQIINEGGQE
jgi:hypothetical protein